MSQCHTNHCTQYCNEATLYSRLHTIAVRCAYSYRYLHRYYNDKMACSHHVNAVYRFYYANSMPYVFVWFLEKQTKG